MPTEPTAEELLELLAAIRDTLAIEPPSTSEEDPSRRALAALEHRKLAEHRALLVLVALENFQRDPGTHPATRTAAWLREQAAKARSDQPPSAGSTSGSCGMTAVGIGGRFRGPGRRPEPLALVRPPQRADRTTAGRADLDPM